MNQALGDKRKGKKEKSNNQIIESNEEGKLEESKYNGSSSPKNQIDSNHANFDSIGDSKENR